MTESGPATDWEEIDRSDDGVGWIAYPDETMQRASHALAVDDEVWLVDPVDIEGLDDLLAEFGEVAGVVILLDRHKRDCARIANRYDVSVWIPEFMDGVEAEMDAPVERFRYDLADTGYAAHKLYDNRFWQEALLYGEDSEVLVVPEAVGSTDYFKVGNHALGVHPMLRMTPPDKLTRLDPESVRVGHGAGVQHNAADAIEDAVDGSRRRTPGLYAKNLQKLIFG